MFKDRSILIIGLIVGALTYAVLNWDRAYHSMVSNPTPGEATLALAIWISCLAVYFLFVPIGLIRAKASKGLPLWPIKGAILLAAGIAIFSIFFSANIRWSGLFNTDAELLFIPYITASIAYALSVTKAFSSYRAKAWSKLVVSLGVVLASGFIVFACSWAVLYFE